MFNIKETYNEGNICVECCGIGTYECLSNHIYDGNIRNTDVDGAYQIALKRVAKIINNILLNDDDDRIIDVGGLYSRVRITCVDLRDGHRNYRDFKLGHNKNREKFSNLVKEYDRFKGKTQSQFLSICKDHGIVLI